MGTTEKNSVVVELYDLTLTERKDDRFGRVVTSKSLSEDDMIGNFRENYRGPANGLYLA